MNYKRNKLFERRHCVVILSAEYDSERGYRPSLRFEGVEHYYPMNHPDNGEPWYWGMNFDECERAAQLLNKRRGLSTKDVIEIRHSCVPGTEQWISAEERYEH